MSGDGNFRLGREMNGNKDPDDIALADGNAYFVEWLKFEEYLKLAGNMPDEVRTDSPNSLMRILKA